MKNKLIKVMVLTVFIFNLVGPCSNFNAYANIALPEPGFRVPLSLPFDPPTLIGIKVTPNAPLKFEFILDTGNGKLGNAQLKQESTKLVKYFLTALTVPRQDLWVNLSPYEKNRIVPQSFGLTQMGRDLLAQDYMLKQITASMIYPEDRIGKNFWKRIYQEAARRYGTTNISVNTFNKVWIVPAKAIVFDNNKAHAAYIAESSLTVLLDEDYLSFKKHLNIKINGKSPKDTDQLGSQISREILIPELTREVNKSKDFSQLRQVYNALILAIWYQKKIRDSLLEHAYVGMKKVGGVNIDDPMEKERIYQRYLRAFKLGAFNLIKEEIDPISKQSIARKYFSGGAWLAQADRTISIQAFPKGFGRINNSAQLSRITVDLKILSMNDSPRKNLAMSTQLFNEEIDRIARDKGIVLGANTKVGLFVGGPHIQDGYYYELFDKIVRDQYHFDMVYLPYPIAKDNLYKVDLVKEQIKVNPRLVGAVITRPLKGTFFEKGDNLIEAVNFIVKDPRTQQVNRYAVDGEAWLKGLNHDLGYNFDFRGKKIVIIGSGGAASEIAETLNGRKVSTVSFVDRDEERSKALLTTVRNFKADYVSKSVVNQVAQGEALLDQAIEEADLIINATGIGRKETLGVSPLGNHKVFHVGQVLVDLISDTQTQIMIEARKQGVTKVFNGKSMFVYGMEIFMNRWMSKFESTQLIPTEEELSRKIFHWLDNQAMLGVDMQIPRWMDLRKMVTQATFVFDIDKTLTTGGNGALTGENLDQLIRAIRLRQMRPDLKIKIILISGSAYKRYVLSRFGKKASQLNWDEIKAQQIAQGIPATVIDEVKHEIEMSAGSEGVFLNIKPALEQRVVHVIMERLRMEGIEIDPDALQVIATTGGETASYDQDKKAFVFKKAQGVSFNETEQLEISRSLAINYLKALGQRLQKNFHNEIERLQDTKKFLGENGLQEEFERITKGMDVKLMPFDHETHIVFNNLAYAVDGVSVSKEAFIDFKGSSGFRKEAKYYPKGGANFIIISLVDKSDQIEQRVSKGEIIIGGGDSTTDGFLWDKRFEDQMLPIFFGKREHVADFPSVIVALDADGKDAVYEAGSGQLMKNVLDAMQEGKAWGQVCFLNNRHAPDERSILGKGNMAMKTKENTGGIDLGLADTQLLTGDGRDFNIDQAMFEKLKNSPGLVPVIINILPMRDLKLFLGLEEVIL